MKNIVKWIKDNVRPIIKFRFDKDRLEDLKADQLGIGAATEDIGKRLSVGFKVRF